MSKLHSFTRIKKIQFFCFKITPSLLYCSGFQFTTKKKKSTGITNDMKSTQMLVVKNFARSSENFQMHKGCQIFPL